MLKEDFKKLLTAKNAKIIIREVLLKEGKDFKTCPIQTKITKKFPTLRYESKRRTSKLDSLRESLGPESNARKRNSSNS